MPSLIVAVALAGALQSPPVVHGAGRAPQAWAAFVHGQLWVCWRAAPHCWRRISLSAARLPGAAEARDLADAFEQADDDDAALDHPIRGGLDDDPWTQVPMGGDLERAAFTGPDELLLVDTQGRTWQLPRADEQLRPADAGATILAVELARRPRALACSPTGSLPIHDGYAWTWVASACVTGTRCARRVPTLTAGRARVRPTAMTVRLGLGVAVSSGRDVTIATDLDRSASAAALELFATLTLGFDPRTAASRRRQWGALRRAAAADIELPPVVAGPLARAERDAVRAAVCQGTP